MTIIPSLPSRSDQTLSDWLFKVPHNALITIETDGRQWNVGDVTNYPLPRWSGKYDGDVDDSHVNDHLLSNWWEIHNNRQARNYYLRSTNILPQVLWNKHFLIYYFKNIFFSLCTGQFSEIRWSPVLMVIIWEKYQTKPSKTGTFAGSCRNCPWQLLQIFYQGKINSQQTFSFKLGRKWQEYSSRLLHVLWIKHLRYQKYSALSAEESHEMEWNSLNQ